LGGTPFNPGSTREGVVMNLRINHDNSKCQNRALIPKRNLEEGMKKQMVARKYFDDEAKQRIVQLCFDSKSIGKFKPGLKMIFAMDDPPLFVRLEEVDHETFKM
jgi:hypothetical protein